MKIKAEGKAELERFNNVVGKLLSVPHTEIKTKLDAEKRKKKRKSKSFSAVPAPDKRDTPSA
jgi:hypothetical protein